MLFYMGRTAEAEALLRRLLELPEVQQDRLWPRLADAMIALCAAARGETSRVRTAARKVAAAFPRPRTYLEGSARALAGHGLALIGDLHEAAREMRAGGGPRLRRLIVVDRALAIEVLVREARANGARRPGSCGPWGVASPPNAAAAGTVSPSASARSRSSPRRASAIARSATRSSSRPAAWPASSRGSWPHST